MRWRRWRGALPAGERRFRMSPSSRIRQRAVSAVFACWAMQSSPSGCRYRIRRLGHQADVRQDLPEGFQTAEFLPRSRHGRLGGAPSRPQDHGGTPAEAHERQAGRRGVGERLSGYRAALDYLFERTTGGSRFGLERTAALLAALGDPHHRLRIFHVAGTNGKGSACATLAAVLRHRGFRVGKYTSPHLVDFRERFLIDGRAVEETYVVDFIERWTPEVERTGATFFEATTAMAFDWFARSNVDVAVIETGLGGRLDSTNVVRPSWPA